jgi:hypothetical protein
LAKKNQLKKEKKLGMKLSIYDNHMYHNTTEPLKAMFARFAYNHPNSKIRLKFEILIHEKQLNLVLGVNYSKPRVISSRPRVTSSRYGVWTA